MGMLADLLGGLLLILGTLFLFLGSLGLMRMPDIFNRIQAGSKTTTLGTLLTLAGAAVLQPQWVWKLLLIGIFLIFTNPVSAQLLANVAHKKGAKKTPLTKVDKLDEDERTAL